MYVHGEVFFDTWLPKFLVSSIRVKLLQGTRSCLVWLWRGKVRGSRECAADEILKVCCLSVWASSGDDDNVFVVCSVSCRKF